jgi:hypothetical protein
MRVVLYGMLRFERSHVGVAWPWLGLGDPDAGSVLRFPKRFVFDFLAICAGVLAISAANAEYAALAAPSPPLPQPSPHSTLVRGGPLDAPVEPASLIGDSSPLMIDAAWEGFIGLATAPPCAGKEECPVVPKTCRKVQAGSSLPTFVKEPGAIDRSRKLRAARPKASWQLLYTTEILFDAQATELSPGNKRRVEQTLREARGDTTVILTAGDDGTRSEAAPSFQRAAAVWAAFQGKATLLALDWKQPLQEPEPTSRVVGIEVVAPCPN